MEDDGLFWVITIVIFLGIGVMIGTVIGVESSHGGELGQMICDEKAIDKSYALEYDSYNSETETVVCKKRHVERFDGGYVQING